MVARCAAFDGALIHSAARALPGLILTVLAVLPAVAVVAGGPLDRHPVVAWTRLP